MTDSNYLSAPSYAIYILVSSNRLGIQRVKLTPRITCHRGKWPQTLAILLQFLCAGTGFGDLLRTMMLPHPDRWKDGILAWSQLSMKVFIIICWKNRGNTYIHSCTWNVIFLHFASLTIVNLINFLSFFVSTYQGQLSSAAMYLCDNAYAYHKHRRSIWIANNCFCFN